MITSRRRFLSLLLAGAVAPGACSPAKQAPTSSDARDAAERFLSDKSWMSVLREAIRNSEIYEARMPSINTAAQADGPASNVFNPDAAAVSDYQESWQVTPSVNRMDLWPMFSSSSDDVTLVANGPVLLRKPEDVEYLVVLSVSKQSGRVRALLKRCGTS